MRGLDLRSWPVAWTVAVATHVVVAIVPVRLASQDVPQEFVDFQLVDVPAASPPAPKVVPPPAPEPVAPPPEPVRPPGPANPDPDADPNRTSLESNRTDLAPPSEPVPIRTGLALDPSQLVDGAMGVRVGNTNAPGYDADVDPSELRGFVGGGAGGGDGEVVPVVTVDRMAELLRSFQPEYPPRMKQQGIEGRVLLQVVVLPNGRAGKVTLLTGVHPDLDRVAMAAMKRFRWAPARRAGKKVESTVRIAVKFQLT